MAVNWLMVDGFWLVVFRTQVAIATRYKKPFVQCGLRRIRSIANPTPQLTNGSLASEPHHRSRRFRGCFASGYASLGHEKPHHS